MVRQQLPQKQRHNHLTTFNFLGGTIICKIDLKTFFYFCFDQWQKKRQVTPRALLAKRKVELFG